MGEKHFTREEAKAKVGTRVRTKVEFAGVPKGTAGRVVKADYMGKRKPAFEEMQDVWDVVIEWELQDGRLRRAGERYRTGSLSGNTNATLKNSKKNLEKCHE